MKTTLSILASMIITCITLIVLAVCISLTFGLMYIDVVHSVPFCVTAFFSGLCIMIYAGHETYELLEKKGY
jgi:hypothetical protein